MKAPSAYRERTYRGRVRPEGLTAFRTVVQETDLQIYAATDLSRTARASVLRHRGYLEAYIDAHPQFATTLTPWPTEPFMPEVVHRMAAAGQATGVGPMAAVAGAIAEAVGRDLLLRSGEVVVENGGDLFLSAGRPLTVALFAGESPLSMKVGLRVALDRGPRAVCTSSGRIGHSFSRGRADAVCVVAADGALADAAATALGNRIDSAEAIAGAIEFGRRIHGIDGIVAIFRDRIGMWGALDLVPLRGKKG